jgi:hypothetical protein
MWTAEAPADVAPPDERIQAAMLRLNRTALSVTDGSPEEWLARAFRVAPRLVADLQDQKLDFGEVAVVLALAEAGRTPSDRILGMWASERLEWAQIAARLRVDPSALVFRLEGLLRELTPQL